MYLYIWVAKHKNTAVTNPRSTLAKWPVIKVGYATSSAADGLITQQRQSKEFELAVSLERIASANAYGHSAQRKKKLGISLWGSARAEYTHVLAQHAIA